MLSDKIYVIGHKNPDTDSICSAIAYANLKNILAREKKGAKKYVAKRAGHINAETSYVLDRFKVEKPGYVESLEPKMKDVAMRSTEGVQESDSLKTAWSKMKEENMRTFPVNRDGKMVGIVTMGDIARSLLEDHQTTALSSSHATCRNIVDTLEGELLVGNPDAVFTEGEVAIGAAAAELMTQTIKAHSMVIIGNRSDAQISALEKGADWLIVCNGCEVSDMIKKLAESIGCNIIVTPYDTYMTARLINEAMPVKHVMYSGKFFSFNENDFVKDAKKTMMKQRIRYFPVMDKAGRCKGLVSQRNLLDMEKRQVILVDHNEETQAVDGLDAAEVLEVVDHHRIGGLSTSSPVYFRNMPLGCTCTIVAQMYWEHGVDITPNMAGIMCSAILSDTLCFRSPTCTAIDEQVARRLADIAGVDAEKLAMDMFTAGSEFDDKSEEEIFYQDFKAFAVDDIRVGIGQVSVIGTELIMKLKERMMPYITSMYNNTHFDMIMFMLTDIMEESTELIYVGDPDKADVQELISSVFKVEAGEHTATLPGIVSRKKQMVPNITVGIQNL